MAWNKRLAGGFHGLLLCWYNSILLAARQTCHSLYTQTPLASSTSSFMLMTLSSLVLMILLSQISFSGCIRNLLSLTLVLSVFSWALKSYVMLQVSILLNADTLLIFLQNPKWMVPSHVPPHCPPLWHWQQLILKHLMILPCTEAFLVAFIISHSLGLILLSLFIVLANSCINRNSPTGYVQRESCVILNTPSPTAYCCLAATPSHFKRSLTQIGQGTQMIVALLVPTVCFLAQI